MSQEYEHNSSSLESSFYSGGLNDTSTPQNEERSIDDALFDRKEDDFARIDDIGQRRKGGLLSLVLLLAIAGGVLWTMRMLDERAVKQATASGGQQAAVDQLVAKFRKKMADLNHASDGQQSALTETDRILSIFSADLSDRQVKLADLQKNPFQSVIKAPKPSVGDTPDGPPAEILAQLGLTSEEAAVPDVPEIDMFAETLKTFQLGSLVVSDNPLAVINGRVVRVDHTIGPFKVKEINADGVVLTAEDKTYELTRTKKEAQ